MSEQAKALGALLIEIAALSDAAEAHGIIENPPPAILDPLVVRARALGIAFDAPPSLGELHLAVETTAQDVGRPAS